jgi:hypothetical protein
LVLSAPVSVFFAFFPFSPLFSLVFSLSSSLLSSSFYIDNIIGGMKRKQKQRTETKKEEKG